MKRIGMLLLLFVFGFAFAVSGQQNLGELAKKEKARREALEKSGKKVKVLTNDDVANLKSQLAIESGSSEAEGSTAEEGSTYTPPQEGQDYVPEPEPEPAPVDQTAERQKQISDLENQRDQAQKESDDARGTVGAGGLYHTRNTGDQYRKAREAEKKIEELNKKLEDLNSNQRQAQEPAPAPPPEEYIPPEETTTEEVPVEEPPLQ